MTRLAGLASERGRTLLHVDELEPGDAQLAVVVSDRADAPVLDAAAERDIPTEVVEPDGDDQATYERRLLDALTDYDVDLVCLDEFTRSLSTTFLDAAPPALDAHPSLLPSFPGADALEQALDAGVAVTGCTVHVVADASDSGAETDDAAILAQEPVAVHADDDVASLERRVRHDATFRAYSRAVRRVADGDAEITPEGSVRTVGTDDSDRDNGADDTGTDDSAEDIGFPSHRLASADRASDLRYGENPHQDAAVYADYATEDASVVHADQLNDGAKALSYNNYNDADAALGLVREFEEPAAAVIKHTNPAGAATADTLEGAYADALATDPKSAFGGIVALNRTCDAATADLVTESFKEVVVAPDYTDDALAVFRESSNLRVLAVGPLGEWRTDTTREKDLVGGTLVQERDLWAPEREDLEIVTERDPTDEEVETMLFAWRVLKHAKSNAILFADDTETVGLGVGQVSRVDAVELAAKKAGRDAEGKDAAGSVMASDAFFPFPDGIEAAADAGVEAVVQPGGSVNDDDVIEAADEHGMAMAFTGHRSFRHD